MEDYFDNLPSDQLVLIALELQSSQILYFCNSNNRFNKVICHNDRFWHLKFIRDFGLPDYPITDWKSAYKDHGSTIKLTNMTRIGVKFKYITSSRTHMMGIDLDDNIWTIEQRIYQDAVLQVRPMIMHDIKGKSVSSGIFHNIVIDLDDNVWAIGDNTFGELGLGDNERRNVYTQIPNLKAKAVSCGDYQTLIIDLHNNLLVFGSNSGGVLGLGGLKRVDIPTQIPNIKAKFVACNRQTMIIDLDNNVWASGENYNGYFGSPNFLLQKVFTQMPNVKAKMVACGSQHYLLIDLDDNVWTFGIGNSGQLGLGNYKRVDILTQIPNLKGKYVACSATQTIVIDLDNNIWGFGSNHGASLGFPFYLYFPQRLRVDPQHWLFLSSQETRSFSDTTTPQRILGLKANSVAISDTSAIVIAIPNKIIVSFDEISNKLLNQEIIKFEILPEHQNVYHNPNNVIATFMGSDNYIYLSEIQYDSVTNEILPPIV